MTEKSERVMKPNGIAFCKAAKYLFKKSDFTTQASLADAAGVNSTIITAVFYGQNAYGFLMQKRIAKALDYSWEQMIKIGTLLMHEADPSQFIKPHGSYNFPNHVLKNYPGIVPYIKTMEQLDTVADDIPSVAHIGLLEVFEKILGVIKSTKPPTPVEHPILAEKAPELLDIKLDPEWIDHHASSRLDDSIGRTTDTNTGDISIAEMSQLSTENLVDRH